MLSGAAVVTTLQILAVVGCILTSAKLFATKLSKKYRILFAYLIFRSILTCIFLSLSDVSSQLYLKVWIVTEPFVWLFYALLVRELYSLVLERHRGLYTIGRWFLYAGMSVSIFISALTFLPHIHRGISQRSAVLGYYMAVERGIDFSLLIFLLLLLFWLTRYPVPLSRNVLVHGAAYSIVFLSGSVGVFARAALGLQISGAVNTFLMGVFPACVLIWLLFLTPKGEEVQMSIPHFSPEQEKRILSKLDSLNETLLKATRK
ncbi:MAG TPA: hypothetical protein VG675_23065 [Bryobacteraceae bacterium]|nr:hypothetical protein [Bryobacteraceae bacterium]